MKVFLIFLDIVQSLLGLLLCYFVCIERGLVMGLVSLTIYVMSLWLTRFDEKPLREILYKK